MTRCPEGHFYDPAKHSACPWCALPRDMGAADQKTRPMRPEAPVVTPPLMPGAGSPPHAPTPPPNATVRVGASAIAGIKKEPVAGWLVCLEGPDRGRDYRLRMEKNFIGRAPHMDVVLDGDDSVSRERHAIVIFDPKKKTFWALPGEASGLVYLNGDIVNSPAQMKADDILEIGKTKLVLVPFCGDRYSWLNESAPGEG